MKKIIKIVINVQHGGFHLSTEAVKYLIKINSPLIKKYRLEEWTRTPEETRAEFIKNVGDGFKEHKWLEGVFLKDDIVYGPQVDDTERAHPDLVEVVDKLGDKASGRYSKLRIIEIPADVDWVIEEYDGYEWVAEKHREWHHIERETENMSSS